MELLRIGEEKLKIILTHEDLLSFEMNEDDLDYANTETKRMLWNILHDAKSSVGFNADGHRVLVQLYPSKGGGCEMFVTRLGALSCDCPPEPRDTNEQEKEDVCLHRSQKSLSSLPNLPKNGRLGAFCFETLNDLLSACRRLASLPQRGRSYAYRSDDGRYYLFLDGLDATGYFSVDEFSFLHEYGDSQPPHTAQTMLSEHGVLFCPTDAVEKLSVL